MSKIVIWTKGASDDVEKHHNELKGKNPAAAVKAVKAILSQGDNLGLMPYKGTALVSKPNVRKWPVEFGKSGYVIHYVVTDDAVVISKVYHGRQDRPV